MAGGMGGTYFVAWNVIHVDIGSERSGEEVLDVYKAFADKNSEGRSDNFRN